MDPDGLLDGLDASQRAAVTSEAAPLCILAGAGSGKTRVLTRRIAWRVAQGHADPRRVLALTFTRKAAGELTARLGALGMRDRVAAGTFHAVAYAQLRRRWADLRVTPPTLLDRKLRLVGDVEIAAEIEWAKARLVDPDGYAAAAQRADRRPSCGLAAVADAYRQYESDKQRRRLIDFDDLLALCLRAMDDDAEFAAVQRWRFRHVFVDEFQDVNPVQHRLLEAWRGDRPDLCVVGDPNQAIYAWNGAHPEFLTRFLERHPDGEVVRLDGNHRSSPQILAVAGAVIGDQGAAARCTRPDGPLPRIHDFADDDAEAAAVARQLRDLHGPGVAWSSMAVLVRTNAQCSVIAGALEAAGIPHRQRGRERVLDRHGVREAIAQLEAGSRQRPLSDALADIDEPELVRLARELDGVDPDATVDLFLAWLAAAGAEEPLGRRDAVEVATFHAAKGLEWPIVFVAGVERGLVPIGHAATAAAIDEERRLFYVALTRATRQLRCSWARERTFGAPGRPMERERSPFLDAVDGAMAELTSGAEAPPPPELRRARPTTGDPVLDALRSWRAAAARAAGVPVSALFHDHTLEAVAAIRPRHRRDLVEVPGMGPVKAARYADDLLALVAAAEAS